MEILVVLVVMLVVMLVAARFDNGTQESGQPYSMDEGPRFLSDDDTTTDPMYSHQPDNIFYEDPHSHNE